MYNPRTVHVIPLLHNLPWLLVFFQVQFKVLVMTCKALRNMKPGYLRDCHFLVMPTVPSSPAEGHCGGLCLPRSFIWQNPRGEPFPSWHLSCGTSFLRRDWLQPDFMEALKIWFCHSAKDSIKIWSLQDVLECTKLNACKLWKVLSHILFLFIVFNPFSCILMVLFFNCFDGFLWNCVLASHV